MGSYPDLAGMPRARRSMDRTLACEAENLGSTPNERTRNKTPKLGVLLVVDIGRIIFRMVKCGYKIESKYLVHCHCISIYADNSIKSQPVRRAVGAKSARQRQRAI